MSMSTVLLLASLAASRTAWAFNCSIPPIYVDIHKRAVHGTVTFEYGSFMGYGMPAMNQSQWMSLSRNETSVADVDFCQKSNLTNCATSTGGFFDYSESSSFVKDDNYNTSDISIPSSSSDTGFFGYDMLRMYTHFFQSDPAWETDLDHFPIRVVTSGSSLPDRIGLGSRSSLLTRLFSAGMLASRSFSLYVGTGFERCGGAINGSLTLGGYDAARFTGPIVSYPVLEDMHPLGVKVSDLIINQPDGSKVSLLDKNRFPNTPLEFTTGFDARITTDQYPMVFPTEVTKNFMSLLNASPSTHPDGSLALAAPFTGSLTVTLDSGLSITLPSSIVSNGTANLTPIMAPSGQSGNSTSSSNSGPFFLSTAWLTQVYLMVSYDPDLTSTQFHLAPALLTAPYIMPHTRCPRVAPTPYVAPVRHPLQAAGLVGAILGGVIGGIAILTVASCGWLKWRRAVYRRRVARDMVGERAVEMAVRQSVRGVKREWEVDGERDGSDADSIKKEGKKGGLWPLGGGRGARR